MRFAPTEKFAPWLPTTIASKSAFASFTAVCSMEKVSWPRAFILEWNSTRAQPSPRSRREAPGFFLRTAPRSLSAWRSTTPARAGTGETPAGPNIVRAPPSFI